MNIFKTIWKKIKGLFNKRPPSTEHIISEVKSVLAEAEKVEEIYFKIKETTDYKEQENLIKQIARIEVAKEIIEYNENEKVTTIEHKSGRKKFYELHELIIELQKLEEQKAILNIQASKIQPINYLDNSIFESKISNLFSLLTKNKIDDKVELNDFNYSSFDGDLTQLEKLFTEASTLRKYRIREREKKKEREIYENNIKKEFNNLDLLINQSKLEDAKLLVKRLTKSIKPDYKKGTDRLTKAQERLKEKEILLLKKHHEEILKKQAEKVEKIRLQEEIKSEEKRKKELINKLDFEFNSEKEGILENFRIDYVFHMTEVSNIKNIIDYGILSHNEAHSKGLNKTDIALKDVNQRRANKKPIYGISLHDYVPMYFNPKNPMLYRRKQIQNNIVILAIDRRVIYQDKSIFSDGNAASDSTRFFNNISDLVYLNWQCIRNEYWNDFDDGKRLKCAETLTSPKIPIKYVKKIHCNSIQTKNIVDKIVSTEKLFRVELTSKYFFNR